MLAYRTDRRKSWHFDPECPGLTEKKRLKNPLQSTDLVEINRFTDMCKRCTPPELHIKPQTHHSRCEACGHKKPHPCPHNGGVKVLIRTTRRGQEILLRTWRWPENAFGATLADQADQGLASDGRRQGDSHGTTDPRDDADQRDGEHR